MAFVCVLIRTQAKTFKPWYVRSVLDRSITPCRNYFASSLLENLTMDRGKKHRDRYSNNTGNTVTLMVHAFKISVKHRGYCFLSISGLINDKLTCESPIEVPYYVAFNDPLFFFLCGCEVD